MLFPEGWKGSAESPLPKDFHKAQKSPFLWGYRNDKQG